MRIRLGGLLLALLLGCGVLQADEVIIVNSTVADTLPKRALRAIFGMRLGRWPESNHEITVFVLADENPLHAQFCKTTLNVFPHQLRRAWDRLVFSGTGQAPIRLSSEAEMLQRVANTPGAIGYLSKDKVDGRVHVLRIN
ncbi:MAG: hypothetical protein Q9N68_01455 [Gammaproteobacteria bacterium]|nr:hypothetical protein [Gammaproteobacteria bacterium]